MKLALGIIFIAFVAVFWLGCGVMLARYIFQAAELQNFEYQRQAAEAARWKEAKPPSPNGNAEVCI